MDAISEAVIPELDAVVLVLSAGSPFSKSEAEFVRNKLMTSDVTRMIVLVNRIDMIYDEEDRERLLDSIKEKIVKEILERTAAIHGADSKSYKETKDKLADIKLYPISAIQALQGRLKDNPALVQQSGILEFEERLRKLLTEERGALEITRVSSIIASLLQEGKSALELRVSALEMDTEEFLRNKQESEKEIHRLRENKTEEKNRLRKKGMAIKGQLNHIVSDKYTDLEARLNHYIDVYPIDVKSLKSEAGQVEFQKQIGEGLEKEVSNALSEYTEQIHIILREQMGDECLKLQEYVGTLSEQLMSLNRKIKGTSAAEMVTVVGVDALSNLVAATCTGILSTSGFGLMGLGGLIEGYRTNGVKGAATGLAGGFASSTLAAVGLIAALGTVPFLPFAMITGIAGTVGGKFLSSVFWHKDIEQRKKDEFIVELKKTVVQIVDNFRDQKLLEDWAKKQIEEQIDYLVGQVEEEAESMISSTETTLQAIAADIVKASQTKEQKMIEYQQMEEKFGDVSRTLMSIMERVSDVQTA